MNIYFGFTETVKYKEINKINIRMMAITTKIVKILVIEVFPFFR